MGLVMDKITKIVLVAVTGAGGVQEGARCGQGVGGWGGWESS